MSPRFRRHLFLFRPLHSKVELEDGRKNVNLKAWSIPAFIVVTIVNLCFALFGVTMPYYVIVLALLLVIHLWVAWKLSIIKNV